MGCHEGEGYVKCVSHPIEWDIHEFVPLYLRQCQIVMITGVENICDIVENITWANVAWIQHCLWYICNRRMSIDTKTLKQTLLLNIFFK